jgi:hypothetical protein
MPGKHDRATTPGMRRWRRMETRVPKYGRFLTCLTRDEYLGLSVACRRSHAG